MSKKDYELIAEALASVKDDTVRFDLIRVFSRKLKEDNSKFNMVKFARACQPGCNRKELL